MILVKHDSRVRAMSSRLDRRLRGAALLTLCGLTGCSGLFSGHGLPDDPLFISRKPLEAKAVSAPPVVIAHLEPAPPPNPYFAVSHSTSYSRPRPEPGKQTAPDSGAHAADPQDK
jgi:hypothetical protein